MSSQASWGHLVARILAAATRSGRATSHEFSIEGTRLFERALRAKAPIAAALVSNSYGSKERERAVLAELKSSATPVQLVPDEVARELTGGRTFGALLGLVSQVASDLDIPSDADLLVAVDVQDPGNVGALLRTAAASGSAALVAVGTTDVYHPKAVRASMGSLFKLPVLEFNSTEALFTKLKSLGRSTLATTPRNGIAAWSDALPKGPHAVLVGSEAHGLTTEVQLACDARISLPQRDDLDSYSVNAAAAMLLYELRRRRDTR